MNCIFICVFNQEKNVDMFYLLLESILLYGNLGPNTEILVYTSTDFMNMIKQSILYDTNMIKHSVLYDDTKHSVLFDFDEIKFEICDTYDSIDKACKAKLDLFNLPSIIKYNKILYLDTNILIKDDINKVFNVCQDDILYVLEEGFIDDNYDFWGKSLFGDEIDNYEDKTAFTSGILLFNNCHKIKELFIKINEDIINRSYDFVCCDQPYIVYNAFKFDLYNNKILKSLVVNNDTNIYSDKVIHHFPGHPGIYQHKIDAMTIFLNSLKKKHYFKIPKVLFQTNKKKNKDYVLDLINSMLSPDWKYEFYDDDAVIQFFIDNPIDDLPDIIDKFNSFKKGAHRADLFRYYYLYVNGGFFMDSDAMMYVNMDTIIKNYDFVSVNSSFAKGTIFQGILGASPNNKIIKLALYHAYNTDQKSLKKDYLYFCRYLYDVIFNNHFEYNIKLYIEKMRYFRGLANVLDNKNTLLFNHYYKSKVIPNPIDKKDSLCIPIFIIILVIVLAILLAINYSGIMVKKNNVLHNCKKTTIGINMLKKHIKKFN